MSAISSVFFGSWASDKDDNMDAWMESRGVPWLARKAAALATETVAFKDLGGGKYAEVHSMFGRSSTWEFRLGEETKAKGLEGVERQLLVTVDGFSLVVRHRFDLEKKGNIPDDVQVFTVEAGTLVQTLRNGDITAKRYFKKKN